MKNFIEKNVWISKIPLQLWGVGYRVEAKLDNLESPTLVETKIKGTDFKQRLVKASVFEIVFIKYFMVFLLIGVLNTFSFHSDSTTGLGLMGLFYIAGFYIKRKFSFQTMIISLIVFIASVIVYGFFSFIESGGFDFGYIANYMIQYFLIIYAVHHIYDDFLCKGYEGYWKIDRNLFTYLKIIDRDDVKLELDDKNSHAHTKERKKKRYFLIVLFFVSISFLTLGVLDIWKNYVIEKAASENIKKNSKQIYLKKLDQQADKIGIEKYHRVGVDGIERYIILNIDKSVKYAEVLLKNTGTTKDGKIVNSYKLGSEPISKITNYQEDVKFKDVRAFVRGGYWYFISGKEIYKIVSTKAAKSSGGN